MLTSHLDVRFAYQALAIQEQRATYKEQLATISISTPDDRLRQVWFPGNHSDTAQDNGERCLADAVLAWILGRLHEDLQLPLDPTALCERFPGCDMDAVLGCCKPQSSRASSFASPSSASASTSSGAESTMLVCTDWLKGPIKKVGRVHSLIHGKRVRTPGHRMSTGERAMEQISPAVRLRGYGRDRSDQVLVPGYRFDDGEEKYIRVPAERQLGIFAGLPLRVNSGSSSSSGNTQPSTDPVPPFLEEATPTALENALLRYPEMVPQ